jgi:RHS repeat-associated protein
MRANLSPDLQGSEGASARELSASLPALSLPRGGGAIRGIGEKFAANPATGTATLTISLDASPGRSGFGPQLALTYDSGAGNGPFGLGWNVAVPTIARKTENGLPRYADGEESDVFVLSDAEDLVPVLHQGDNGWTRAERVDGNWRIQAYRPRVEGLYARIERWTEAGTGDVHWRVISRDNVTTRYGLTDESRVVDPADRSRVLRWLASESYDDRGNAIVYMYKPEDSTGVEGLRTHERNRTPETRSAQRYLKRVRYGNGTPRRTGEDLSARADWLFEIVFDYGEHYAEDAGVPTLVSVDEAQEWAVRADPFSSYRAGFEVRTYRLCRRILVFHHFPDELGTQDYLVRATHLGYTENSVASVLTSVTRSGYVRRADGSYLLRSYPPLELGYSEATLNTEVREVDSESLSNLPSGLDERSYRWIDLDGDGVAGVLAEQAGGWLYKRNMSPIGDGGRTVRFAPEREVVREPVAVDRQWQWLDVGGDGQLDLVQLTGRAAGFHERTPDGEWEPFVAFTTAPNVAWDDPAVQLVDLTGDGRADVLVTEDDLLRWYPSLGEDGFGRAESVPQVLDEERGPRLLLADGTQSIHLADLSGDGLTDLVRVRNGEVCYWPNLGYGRFGAKVTMDDAPWFDAPDRFDPGRLRFADVDGSGPTDLLYLADDGVRIHANHSGNGWAPHVLVEGFPELSRGSSTHVLDALGNGTACVVWSSSLPGDSRRQMRYVDLMGGQKPHLLTRIANNLGAETRIDYAPSTRFALEDHLAGRPWATRLPFPVQTVERVEVYDWVGRSRFVTRYAYHHGYYDGLEREFRGFGMVEQWDTEEHRDDTHFPDAANWDETSWSPPALTRTWFHTGAFLEAGTISRHFADEYWVEPALRPDDRSADREAMQLPDSALPTGLTPEELREAYRALKSRPLRIEIYGLDGSPRAEHPYTVTEQNFRVRLLQPRGPNPRAVFSTSGHETLSLQYERQPDDPRVTHSLTLEVDEFDDVLRSVSVGYPRRPGNLQPDTSLAPLFQTMLAYDQGRLHVAATETRYTAALTEPALVPDAHRTPLPAETIVAELTGIAPAASSPNVTNLFRSDELDEAWQTVWDGAHDAPYEDVASADVEGSGAVAQVPTRRIVERTQTLYRRDDLTALLPLGQLEPQALSGEHYRLALTQGLVARLFAALVDDALMNEGGYVQLGSPDWWIPSGRVHLSPGDADTPAQELAHAESHFFRPCRAVDPFGGISRSDFDAYDLLTTAVADAVGNTTRSDNDYRVLLPWRITDPNGNRAEDAFDALGLVAGTAVAGKTTEALGDSLAGFDADLDEAVVVAHLDDPLTSPGSIIGAASSRTIYDLSAYARTSDTSDPRPATVYTLTRETHSSDLAAAEESAYQHTFVYWDGFGREIQRKAPAEPGPLVDGGPAVSPRWVGSGWTVRDRKGNAVRSYEPFFSATHDFEFANQAGVATVLFHDAAGRVIATLHPDDTWTKAVFDSWQQVTWDANDTVLVTDPRSDADVGDHLRRFLGTASDAFTSWHGRRSGGGAGTTPDERAAQTDAAGKAAAHAETPTTSHFDALDRTCLTVAHAGADKRVPTRGGLDTRGKTLSLIDALGRRTVEYCLREPDQTGFRYVCGYDLVGSALYENGIDSGERRTLPNVAGKPIRSWNSRGQAFRIRYDALQRPTHRYVSVKGDPEIMLERSIYGEGRHDLNLCGRLFRQYDGSGLVETGRCDFKGNLVDTVRQFAREYRSSIDWLPLADLDEPADLDAAAEALLIAGDRYTATTTYDALNRPIQVVTPHSTTVSPNVVRPSYNEGNLVSRVDAWLRPLEPPSDLLDRETADLHAVTNVDHNARGQRVGITLGNGTETRYTYDPSTFRVSRITTTRPSFEADRRVVQGLSLAYDPIGNVTRIRDDADIQNIVFFRNRRVDPTNDYTYDPLYRLVRATGREHLGQNGSGLASPALVGSDDGGRAGLLDPGDGNAMGTYTESYSYDPVGNLLEVVHQVVSGTWRRQYSYGEQSRIDSTESGNRLSATSLPGDPEGGPYSAKLGYDEHGNTTQMPHVPSLVWDETDRLRATTRQFVLPGNTPETTYLRYDAAGQRVRKVTDGQAGQGRPAATRSKERLYLGVIEVYREFGPDGESVVLQRETLHVNSDRDGIALVEMRTQGVDPGPARLVRYQHRNHVGSVVLELDDVQQVVSYEEFFPYGSTSYQAVGQTGEAPKRYRYSGKERDEESGLYNHGARYYAPWLGRWTAVDPSGGRDGASLYAYVADNPSSKFDPNGLWETDMHFLAVYWAGRMQGAGHATALIAAIGSQSLDDSEKTSAPGIKLAHPTSEAYIQLAQNSHALNVTKSESAVVALRGIKEQNVLLFGLGLHSVGDYLPHANLSGKMSGGHQLGYNEDFSWSSDVLHDADYTYKNPHKALATFERFRKLWSQYLGESGKAYKKLGIDDPALKPIAEFIFTKSDDLKGKEAAATKGLKALGVTDEELADVMKFYRDPNLRLKAMSQMKETVKGGEALALANGLWLSQKKNGSFFNSATIDIRADLLDVAQITTNEFETRRATNLAAMRQGVEDVQKYGKGNPDYPPPEERIYSPR